MSWSKVACMQCSQYQTCSPTTRMFINYCGSDRKNVATRIRSATSECRSHRGYFVLKQDPNGPHSAVLFHEEPVASIAG